MKFKIDLKIFLITFLFFMTSQIKIYITMMICAILHELGHLIMGIILGMKPEKLEIIPIGIRITFKLNIKDINKKVKKANKLEIKKILPCRSKSANTFFRRFSALSRLFPSICTFRAVASSMRFV